MDDRLAFEVELFADLMVQIDDPFTVREAVLMATGLDENTHRNLVEGWRGRFDRDDSGALASRFAERYAARRGVMLELRRREASREAEAADPRFLNTDAQSFREEAAKVGREPVAEEASPSPRPQPAEPSSSVVRPSSMGETPKPPAQPAAPPRELPSFVLAAAATPTIAPTPVSVRPPASFAGTMDISHAVPRASLPFAPASEARAVEPAPVSAPRPHVSTGTADISAVVPRDLLPFPQGAPPAPPRPQPAAATADISAFVPRDLLPFSDTAPPSSVRIAEQPPPAPSISGPVARPPQRFAGTADISAFVPRAATPFATQPAAPAAAAAPPPRKRLIRFDPQTGQPLPEPIWVDLPPESEGQEK